MICGDIRTGRPADMSLEVRADAVSPSVWDAYVTGHPQGSLFHLQGWREVVSRTYRLPAVRLTAHRGDALLGGVTLYQAVGPYGERYLSTLPYSAYRHALLADDASVRLALVDASRREAQRRRCRFVELKEAVGLPGMSVPRPVYGHYSLSLTGG